MLIQHLINIMAGIKNRLEWICSDVSLPLWKKTHIMGILNVTPDSFSDGGKFIKTDTAVECALKMVKDGADIIDIGGESTRPGAEPVSEAEELDRVLPVIEAIAKETATPISIDTYKSNVAEQALMAGAKIVNDISGFQFDDRIALVAAQYNAGCVLMHIKGEPRNMQKNPHYDDVLGEISDYLRKSISIAQNTGLKKENIVIDPGIGFGKRFVDNLEIIRELKRLTILDCPVLVGPSRKSFIGQILDLLPDQRLEGTAAVVAISIMNGANVVRVHDVKEISRVAKVVDAILQKEILE